MDSQTAPTAFTAKERLESLKAGFVGAIALGFGFLLTLGLHGLIVRQGLQPIANTLAATLGSPVGYRAWGIPLVPWGNGAIALLSGFLFGVTYRYIVRTDDNPQLKAGAVGAFGLFRGLSQVDAGLTLHGSMGLLGLWVGESLVMVAIAQWSLDWAMGKGWIRPFGTAIDDTPRP